jgi:sugar lactone lactonase YvrE
MKTCFYIILAVVAQFSLATFAVWGHPGSGVVAEEGGNVYVTVTGEWAGGLWRIDPTGEVTRLSTTGAHWLALDIRGSFARSDLDGWFRQRITPWLKRTSLKGAALIQADGSPLAMNRDGSLCYVKVLEVARLSPDGKVTMIAPGIKETVDKLGGLKGLAFDRDGALYGSCPSAILRIKMDGTFTTLVHPVRLEDCDTHLPPNTPSEQSPFLTGLAVSAKGVIYAAATGCRRVVSISPKGQVAVVLKAEPPWSPTGVALHGEDIYVLEHTRANDETHEWQPRVRKVARDGKVTTLLTIPRNTR